MTKVKRLIEQTRHTGEFSYLIGQARTGVSYPVLEEVLDGRYKNTVSQSPFVASDEFFYSLYEPTRAMHQLATDLFLDYLGRPNRRTVRDAAIWRLLGRIHEKLRASTLESRKAADNLIPEIASKLSAKADTPVAGQCLAVTAAVYLQAGVLRFRDALSAAICATTLLVMHGVPRERVAYFGIYYQDPIMSGNSDGAWSNGFYRPAPFHVITAVHIGGNWIPFDFTRTTAGNSGSFPDKTAPYLHDPEIGKDTQQYLDYAYPYTAIFAPPMPDEHSISPLLKYIPRLQTS